MLYLITSSLKIQLKLNFFGHDKTSLTIILLCLASIYFYSVWKIEYTAVLLLSIFINYFFGLTIEKQGRYRKHFTVLGILFNILLLGYFKYAFFIAENLQYVSSIGLNIHKLVLPLGVSFFTFQQIAYLVDIYKKEGESSSFPKYFLFISFFPQLIAGPIVHHKNIIPQFANLDFPVDKAANFAAGLYRFSIGLFKKVVFADTLSTYVLYGYSNSSESDMAISFIATMVYTLQLYFDFSGYCDMAVGAAKMFNIKIPENFLSPYKAVSIQDFWRKWHITLSNWLRDYIYIPLGGNRKGKNRVLANVFITFLIGGIWHGAGWTFIIWGAMHGAASMIHNLWTRLGIKINKIFAWLITFLFVHFTWIFFRADNVDQAFQMIKAYGISPKQDFTVYALPLSIIIFLIMFCIFAPNSARLQENFEENIRMSVTKTILSSIFAAGICALSVLFLMASSTPNFLYFNF